MFGLWTLVKLLWCCQICESQHLIVWMQESAYESKTEIFRVNLEVICSAQ